MYCQKCGKEIPDGARLCDECVGRKRQPIQYVSIALAVLGVILPFLKWLEVPVAKGLYSMLGMGNETPTFSLFGYIFAGSQYQSDKIYFVMLGIAAVALVGIIFNLIYIIKAPKNKPGHYKYGTVGSVILMIMSILFIVIVGMSAAILQIMKLTAMPYIMLAASIANIIIIRKIKKGGNTNVKM